MASAISFGDANSGFQAGTINGPVNTEFHHHHSPPERLETPPNPSAVIPFSRDIDFVERGKILDQIYQKCAVLGSWAALVGLGGVGKSQLAIEYAYQTRDRSPETWVFWVHASNAARFQQSFRDIANRVKVPGWQNPSANILQLVHDWLCDDRKGQWVLILDNVDDAGFLVEARGAGPDGQTNSSDKGYSKPLVSYLPQCLNGSILITTRSKIAALKLVEQRNIIAIESMSSEDALTLLEKKLGGNKDGDDVAELAAELEFMPLAIVQAAAYISERAPRCSVRGYLQDFRRNDRKRTSLLEIEGEGLRRDWEAKNSIIITWQISFDHIRIPEAVLRNRGEHRNSRQDQKECNDDLHAGYSDDDEDDTSWYTVSDDDDDTSQSSVNDGFEDDILTLRNYSFISINADGTTFEMHRLVQLAMRKWLEAHGLQESWKQQFLRKLHTELPTTGEYENWVKCQALFPHVQSAAAQQPKEQNSLEYWASILHRAAWYAWTMGNGVDAEKMSIQALKVRKRILGQEHNDTLDSMGMVGLVYKLRGRWDEAEELEMQVMEIRKTKLGADHPQTLNSMNNLASTYWNQGRWDKAEELQMQVIEIRKTKLGADHPDILTSMNNLALTYRNQGRWDEAEELQMQVIEIRKMKLGADHPDTLISMNNLALTYKYQGRLDEAEELQMQVIEIRKMKLGADHPDTLISMNNLAWIWKEKGRELEAVKLMEECVQSRKRVLGLDHPHTLSSCKALVIWQRSHSPKPPKGLKRMMKFTFWSKGADKLFRNRK